MKQATKIFIIVGMVVGALAILPLIFGYLGLKKLEEAKTVKELTNTAILVLIFCSVVGGVMMLCMKDQDLIEN